MRRIDQHSSKKPTSRTRPVLICSSCSASFFPHHSLPEPHRIPPYPTSSPGPVASFRRTTPRLANVASGQAAAASLASSGASFANLANITTSFLKLPTSLQVYLDGAFDHLTGASDRLQAVTGLSPTALYGTAGAILLLGTVPTVAWRNAQGKTKAGKGGGGIMSRYGWSSRPQLSSYTSNLGDGTGVAPSITDQDFSYITSEDLEGDRYSYDPRESGSHLSRQAAPQPPEDDVLLIEKTKGKFYGERFPAFSIGDGKLLVGDVIERVAMVMQLSERRAKRVKLLYKGRQLKDYEAPIRLYGVKNNSKIMVVIGDSGGEASSDDGRDDVVVIEQDDGHRKKSKKRRKPKKTGSDGSRSNAGSNDGSNAGSNAGSYVGGSAAGSYVGGSTAGSYVGSNAGLEVPQVGGGRGGSSSRPQSPASGVSGTSTASAVRNGPMEQLNNISSSFTTNLLPLCVQFTANPPADPKKRQDEHRKLSETIMQQTLLKLDAVDTGGDDAVRQARKGLVRQIQDVLKGLDARL